jgi:hypothetical protein
MIRMASVALAGLCFAAPSLASANVCHGGSTGVARSPQLVALAAGDDLAGASAHLLGTHPNEHLSVSAVLLRRQLGACGPSSEFAGYVPKTQHDNTPWRFNADSGKGLSAAEFDAWMKSRGVRVARGRAESEAEEPPVVSQ